MNLIYYLPSLLDVEFYSSKDMAELFDPVVNQILLLISGQVNDANEINSLNKISVSILCQENTYLSHL